MAYGPVNVPGTSSADLAELRAELKSLEQRIADGTIAAKPVFPVVAADPAEPVQGEAWILAGTPEAAKNEEEKSDG